MRIDYQFLLNVVQIPECLAIDFVYLLRNYVIKHLPNVVILLLYNNHKYL